MTIGQFASLTFGLAGGALVLDFFLAIIGVLVIGSARKTGSVLIGWSAIVFGWALSALMWLAAIISAFAWIITACTGGFN